MSRSPRDPPSGVSRTVVVAAVVLAVALLAPSLSWGVGPPSGRRDPPASAARP